MKKRVALLSRAHRAAWLVTPLLALALAIAPPALATPTGEFAVFADCPLTVSGLNACMYATTEHGSFTVGRKTVPIENPTVLQGGLKETPVGSGSLEFVAAADGNTLSKTPQNVPGGLAGLINCTEIVGNGLLESLARGTCKGVFENGVTGVKATVELAAPASHIGISLANLLNASGVALSLPVKVHLENPLLGNECYIGSNAAPVVIDFTTGMTSPPPPNQPITGSVGEVEVTEAELVRIHHNSLVNNSFPAPAAAGCGGLLALVIDPLVNLQLGLPAPAGHNTAILTGTLQQASVEQVKAHE